MNTCARRRGCTNSTSDEVCRVCPYSLECPVCHQPEGSPCRRPSGHNCGPHAPRIDAADRLALALYRRQLVVENGEAWVRQWETKLNRPTPGGS